MAEKLVRDLVPAHMIATRTERPIRIAAPEEIEQFLLRKIPEEATEVLDAATSADRMGDLLGELADLVEVIHAVASYYSWTAQDIEDARAAKARTHGRFQYNLIMQIDT